MSTPDLKRLFKPGQGAVPPYLAGRKKEQAYFQNCVDALKDREPVSQDMILYGPRGNGKTALLEYLQIKTRHKEGSKLDILWVTPNEMATLADLSDRLMENQQTARKRLKSAEVSGGVGFIQAKTTVDLSPTPATIRKLLQARSKNKPLILIIDEAHRLQPVVAESLLNASQIVRKTNPFLLVLAGTPNLSAALGQANASFWDRSKKLPLGRLSTDEAGQAITIPLQKAGITFAPGVIETIVAQTHCYPFFIQVWGDCLAQRLQQTGKRMISMETVNEVEAAVIDERDAMYDIRFSEIKRMKLLSIAKSVADAFSECGEPILHGIELDKAIERGLAEDAPIMRKWGMEEALDQLSQLGYVWRIRVPGGYAYEPGIPSLMTYVNNQMQVKGAPSTTDQTEKWRVKPKVHDADIEM